MITLRFPWSLHGKRYEPGTPIPANEALLAALTQMYGADAIQECPMAPQDVQTSVEASKDRTDTTPGQRSAPTIVTKRVTAMMRRALMLFLLLVAAVVGLSTAQAQQFTYPTFAPYYGLTLAGDAVVKGNRIDLTPSFPYGYSGAVWHSQRVFIGGGFVTTAQFTISERSGQVDYLGRRGGDGFAFVIQGFGDGVLGNDGGGLGYDGLPNSLAIEFDAYANNEWFGQIDSSSLSISIHTNGAGINRADEIYSIARNDRPRVQFDDGRVHTMRVVYQYSVLSVFLDNCALPELYVAVDLESVLYLQGAQAWVGFTAGTAGSYERHTLYSWCYTSWPKLAIDYCPCSPPPVADSIIVKGPPDTVHVHDIIRDTVTITVPVHDTTRHTDTLTVVDTLRTTDTIATTDTITVRDTIQILLTDTLVLVRTDTVQVHDTATVILYRDTLLTTDTIYVACYDPFQPFDTLCGGDYRIMEWLDHWLRIVSVVPNPASRTATVTYDTDDGEAYHLALYGADGRLVMVIADEPPAPGRRVTTPVDLGLVPPGRYILILRSGKRLRWTWLYVVN
jgi:hypothetical protein